MLLLQLRRISRHLSGPAEATQSAEHDDTLTLGHYHLLLEQQNIMFNASLRSDIGCNKLQTKIDHTRNE